MSELVVGAEPPVRIPGPATVTHEGGDEIWIFDTETQGEGPVDTLHFEGVENEAEQNFEPATEAARSFEVPSRGVLLTARGQANVSVTPKELPKPKAKAKPAPKKKAK